MLLLSLKNIFTYLWIHLVTKNFLFYETLMFMRDNICYLLLRKREDQDHCCLNTILNIQEIKDNKNYL